MSDKHADKHCEKRSDAHSHGHDTEVTKTSSSHAHGHTVIKTVYVTATAESTAISSSTNKGTPGPTAPSIPSNPPTAKPTDPPNTSGPKPSKTPPFVPIEPREYSSDNMSGYPFAPKLPLLGEHIERLDQIVYCLTLLLHGSTFAWETDSELAKKELACLELIKKHPGEANRLRSIVIKMVDAFVADDDDKDWTKISEVAAIAPFLQKETYRKLLESFIFKFNEDCDLDLEVLQGLVQVAQAAQAGYLIAEYLIKILRALRFRLQSTHQHSTEHSCHLALAVSRIIDVMADQKVKDVGHIIEKVQLSNGLSGLKGTSDPYLMYKACYAFYALQYVSENETPLQSVSKQSTSTTVNLEVRSVIKAIGSMQQSTIAETSPDFRGVPSLSSSGHSVLSALKQGLNAGQKRPWYVAIRAAQTLAKSYKFGDLRKLIKTVSCHQDPLFQWGICQLLGEIAIW